MISILGMLFIVSFCVSLYFRIKSLEPHELYGFAVSAILASVLLVLILPPPQWIFSLAFTGAAFSYYFFSRKPGSSALQAGAVCAIITVSFLLSGCSSRPNVLPVIKEEIKLGFTPTALAVSARDELYIGAENRSFVSVYGLREKKELKKISCGRSPSDIVIKGDMVYITGKLDETLTVYNSVTGGTYTLKVQGRTPLSVAVNPEQTRAYTANSGGSNVSIIDLEKREVAGKVETGKWPSDVLLSSDGKKLYAACKYTNTIQVIDPEKGKNLFTKIETGVSPLKLLPFGRRLVAVIHEWVHQYYTGHRPREREKPFYKDRDRRVSPETPAFWPQACGGNT